MSLNLQTVKNIIALNPPEDFSTITKRYNLFLHTIGNTGVFKTKDDLRMIINDPINKGIYILYRDDLGIIGWKSNDSIENPETKSYEEIFKSI